MSFVVDNAQGVTSSQSMQSMQSLLGDVSVESREVTLRELFLALASRPTPAATLEKAS